MANPNPFYNAIFEGDVTVRTPANVAANGPGNLFVEGKTLLQSTASDAFRVNGSSIFDANINIGGYLGLQAGKWRSTGTDVLINAASDSVILRTGEGQTGGQFESSLTNFAFYDTGGASSVSIRKTDGAVSIAGKISALSDLNVQGDTIIQGNLTVYGPKTRIETQVTTVRDNVLCVNYAPGLFNDGGYAIKRYQSANDTADGAVVQDTAFYTGTVVSATGTTIVFDSGASTVNDFYKGAWVSIVTGVGAGQVRRIKSYVGSTKTATIISTADETATPSVPVEGLDFTTVPTNSSTFSLFVNQFVISYWRESSNEYVLGASCVDPTSNAIVMTYTPLDVRAGNLKLEKVLNVDTINGYTSGNGVTVSGVNVKNGALSGVTTINGALPPSIQTVPLVDTMTTPVEIQTVRQSGVYLIIVNSANGTGSSGLFIGNKAAGQIGGINRLATTSGSAGERVDMVWQSTGSPRLFFSKLPTGGTGATVNYIVTVYT